MLKVFKFRRFIIIHNLDNFTFWTEIQPIIQKKKNAVYHFTSLHFTAKQVAMLCESISL